MPVSRAAAEIVSILNAGRYGANSHDPENRKKVVVWAKRGIEWAEAAEIENYYYANMCNTLAYYYRNSLGGLTPNQAEDDRLCLVVRRQERRAKRRRAAEAAKRPPESPYHDREWEWQHGLRGRDGLLRG